MSIDVVKVRSDIVDLLAAIAISCDWGTVEEYLELLDDQAVWEMPPNDDLGLPATRRAGHEEIEAGVRERRGLGLQGPGSNTIHVTASSTISVSSDTEASSQSAWMYFGRVDGQLVMKSSGRYDDQFVLGDDRRWRLKHRRVVFI